MTSGGENIPTRIAKILVGGAALLAALCAVPAFSQSPDYIGIDNAGPPLKLGHGFVQNNLMHVPLYDCFDSDPLPPVGNEAPSNFDIQYSTASSAQSLLNALGVDLEAAYHNIGASVEAKYASSERAVNDSFGATTLITATIDYPNRDFKNPSLRDPYRKLLTDGAIPEFVQKCGARLAVQEKRGIRLYVLITIETASAELRRQMNASVSGSYGIGPLSASAKAQFNQEMQSKTDELKVNVQASGRGNPVGLDDLIKATIKGKTSLDDIGQALANLIRSLNSSNAAPLGYFVSDIPDIDVAAQDPWSLEKQARLRTMFETYASLAEKRTILQSIISHNDPRYVTFEPDQLVSMRGVVDQISEAMAILVDQHSNCRASIPPNLGPCLGVPDKVKAALEIRTLGPIVPPNAAFAIGVREGKDPKNPALGDWRIMSIEQVDSVMLSPVANALPATSNSDLSDYFAHFKKRLRSADAASRRFQLGIAMRGEDIISAELVARLNSNTSLPDETRNISLQSWGRDDLRLNVALRSVGSFKSYGRGFSGDDMFFRIKSDFVDPLPPGCGKCADYDEPAFRGSLSDLGIERPLFQAVQRWLDAGVRNGSGAISLKVRDQFTPKLLLFDIINLGWTDTGRKGSCSANESQMTCNHFYALTYSPASGEKSEKVEIEGFFETTNQHSPGCPPICFPMKPYRVMSDKGK